MIARVRILGKSVRLDGALNKMYEARKAAITAIAQSAARDSEPLVPRLTGDLRQTAEVNSIYDEGKLIWGDASVPYARPHYYAPGDWNYTTPGTGPEWFEKAKQKHLDQWIKEGEQAAKEVL